MKRLWKRLKSLFCGPRCCECRKQITAEEKKEYDGMCTDCWLPF